MDKLAWLNKFYKQKTKKKKKDKKREKEIKTYHIYDTNMNHVKILL